MHDDQRSVSDLPTAMWSQMQALVEQFEDAWERNGAPSLESYVIGEGELRPTLASALIRIDMEYRFARGEAPRVESYLERFPELTNDARRLIDLIVAEFWLRKSREPTLAEGEYVARFPALAAPLVEAISRLSGEMSTQAWTPIADTTGFARRTTEQVSAAAGTLPAIPGYEVLTIIASGGMGSVYRARDVALDRLVAIKLPRFEFVDEEGRKRFLREARATARLRHPNLCPIHRVGEVDGRPYLAMALITGPTLFERLQGQAPTGREAAEIVAKLAKAVEFAHQRGVVHRDIKPANVLLDAETGEPVLTDFGLAKELSDADVQMTQTGQVMGTPAYMAPEQAAGDGNRVGPATDIYALGAVLYELLCGQPPFGGTTGEILRKVQTEDPPPPRKLKSRLHRDLETICLKAIARRPEDRYGSAAALADDLERFIAGESILARPTGLATRAMRVLRRNPKTAMTIGASAAIVIATLLAGLTFVGRQQLLKRWQQELTIAAGDWDEATLRDLDGRVAELDHLVERIERLAPVEGQAAARRVTHSLRSAIETQLRRERIDMAGQKLTRALLAHLAPRDATAAERLSRQLESMLAGWTPIPLLDGDASQTIRAFPNAAVSLTGERLARRGGEGNLSNLVVSSTVPSPADARIEATFHGVTGTNEEFGLVIGAAQGHGDDVVSLDFSPDGRWLASGSIDKTAKVWDLQKQVQAASFPMGVGVDQVTFGHDSRLLAIRNWGRFFLYDWAANQRIAEGFAICQFAASRDRRLAATQDREAIVVYSLTSGESLGQVATPRGVTSNRLAISDDRRTLVAAQGGDIVVWNWPTNDVRWRHAFARGSECVGVSLNDEEGILAAAARSGDVVAWRLEDGQEFAKLDLGRALNEAVLSPDGRRLAVTFSGGESAIYDLASQKIVLGPLIDGWGLLKVSYTRGGELLAAAGGDSLARWEIASGKKLPPLSGHTQEIRAICAGDEPPRLASGDRGALIRVWDANSGRSLAALGADACVLRVRIASETSSKPTLIAGLYLSGSPAGEQHIPLTANQLRQPIRLRLEKVHGLIRAAVNPHDDNSADVEFQELFPAPLGGTFGVLWPEGMEIDHLVAHRRKPAAAQKQFDLAEQFHAEGKYDAAAVSFHAVARWLEEEQAQQPDSLWQEARYKEAICLQAAGDASGATSVFEELRKKPGRRWPVYALVQLWTRKFLDGKIEEAEGHLQEAQRRGIHFAQLAALLPQEIRIQLIAANRRYFNVAESYFNFVPNRIQHLHRQCELERLVLGAPSPTSLLQLVRAHRLEGNLSAAIDVLKPVQGSPQSHDGDLVDELAWTLREQQRPAEAAKLLDAFLAKADEEFAYMQVERAYVDIAQGNPEAAARRLDQFAAKGLNDIGYGYSRKYVLMRGFLYYDQGQPDKARALWSKGLHSIPRVGNRRVAHTATDYLFITLFSSLSGEVTDEEAALSLESVFNQLSGGSTMPRSIQLMFGGSGAVSTRLAPRLNQMWKTPEGMRLARRIAYQQASFLETVRDPAILLALQLVGPKIRPEGLSSEERELFWELGERFYHSMVLENVVGLTHLLALEAGRKDPNAVLSMLDFFKESPEIRGRLAYFYGVLHGDRPEVAEACFNLALEHSEPNSLLSRLTLVEQAKLSDKPQ